MIFFLLSRNHPYTIKSFFDSWGPILKSRVCIISYEKIVLTRRFPGGVYIFLDLERLLGWELAFAKRLGARLNAFPDHYTILNNPNHWVSRFDFLRNLYILGINDFNVHRVKELGPHIKFPVFLKRDFDHSDSRSPLLYSPDEVKQALKDSTCIYDALLRHRLMIVEYCDTADSQKVFRKYSFMNIDGAFFPRHILFSKNWINKSPDLVNETTLQEETEFLKRSLHLDPIRKIFNLAGIKYGRIDYSVKKGRLQVWEINTNPIIVPEVKRLCEKRLPLQRKSAYLILQAFQKLSGCSQTEGVRPFLSFELASLKKAQLFSRIYGPFRK